jgi:TonB family protein
MKTANYVLGVLLLFAATVVAQVKGGEVKVSAGVEQGLLIRQVKPAYPKAAREAGMQGTVVLRAQISKEGDIINLELISGPPVLADAAIEAVKQWKYRPYLMKGEPVVVDTEVQINFSLPEKAPAPVVPYAAAETGNAQAAELGWALVWSDEFNGPNGSPPDPAKWTLETGGNGWGNNELEYYTDRPQNAYQQDGNLVIKVLAEKYTGADGVTRNYTSARLKTQAKFTQTQGRFEARIKIPRGQGIWPAFWMLGADIGSVGWPACGEIDIMENIGKEPGTVHGTLHGPGYSGDHAIGAPFHSLADQRLADDFHVYAVEWDADAIRFYVDDRLYEIRTPADLPAGTKWVYDHPFFILLNVAVGGGWPGDPDASSTYPQTMLVDYVRVYQGYRRTRVNSGVQR